MPLQQQPPWTALVQVLDLAIGESAGYTLRCYLPAEDPTRTPTRRSSPSTASYWSSTTCPRWSTTCAAPTSTTCTDLADWRLVQHGIDAATAERYTVEAYELDLIVANIGHGTKEWSPDLLVAARDLAVELGNALDVRPVLARVRAREPARPARRHDARPPGPAGRPVVEGPPAER